MIVITFKSHGTDEQFLISNWTEDGTLFRGIAVTPKQIRVYDAIDRELDYMPIEYVQKRILGLPCAVSG